MREALASWTPIAGAERMSTFAAELAGAELEERKAITRAG
jgi:hypothetical protein